MYPFILREDLRMLNYLKRGDLGSLVLPDEHETIGMGHSGIESFGHIDSWTSTSTFYNTT